MFNIKPDRRVVEILIEYNIDAIADWLKSGGKPEDIDKISRDSWKKTTSQKYAIDMIPIGKTSNAYYHRNKGLISQNLSGIDYLNNVDEEVKFFAKKAGIDGIEWSIWKGSLLLMIHGKEGREIILATPPLTEVVELETKGKLTHTGRTRDEDQKVKVTISLNEDGSPKEFMEVWRGAPSGQSLGYGNALGHVSFSVLNFEVEY